MRDLTSKFSVGFSIYDELCLQELRECQEVDVGDRRDERSSSDKSGETQDKADQKIMFITECEIEIKMGSLFTVVWESSG